MRRPLAERQVMLLGVTVAAIAVSLAVTTRRDHQKAVAALPAAVGSYTALAATVGKQRAARTACGVTLKPRLVGVMSPVLPCGVRLYVAYRARHALVSVVGRGPSAPGAELGLTPALAKRLGVSGVRRIQWSYAAVP